MNWQELNDWRENHRTRCVRLKMPVHPTIGPWFTESDSPERGAREVLDLPSVRCGMCGNLGRVYQDHCHYTGLCRGWLCPGCNTAEAYGYGAVWDAWRVSAPHIEDRRFYKAPAAYHDGTHCASGLPMGVFKSYGMVHLLVEKAANEGYRSALTEQKRAARQR